MTEASYKFELIDNGSPAWDVKSRTLRVTHVSTGMTWDFHSGNNESDIKLRERAIKTIAFSLADDEDKPESTPSTPTLAEAMEMLAILYFDMHPVYGSTAPRGRGMGGSTVTRQCSVLHPEGWEVPFLDRVMEAIHAYAEVSPGYTGRTAQYISQMRRQLQADAITVNEAELRIDLISNAAPYPFTKSTLIVTHTPSGIQARRDLYEHSSPAHVTQQQARLDCIEEILGKLREKILHPNPYAKNNPHPNKES